MKKVYGWVVRYMENPFSFDDMNEIINDYHCYGSHSEQIKAIAILRYQYDAKNNRK